MWFDTSSKYDVFYRLIDAWIKRLMLEIHNIKPINLHNKTKIQGFGFNF